MRLTARTVPRLLVAAHPTRGVDVGAQAVIWELLKDARAAGMGILLIDHNVRRVVKMSDRIHVLSLGRITAAGGREDFEGDLHEQVRQWLGLDF